MKKLLFLLALLPFVATASAFKCPQNADVKITCITQKNKTTTKKVVYAHGIPTEYNVAFPECKIKRDTSLRDQEGNFRIYDMAKGLCGIRDYTQDIKIRFSSGRNWFFGKWLKNVARTWVYTPANKKFKEVK